MESSSIAAPGIRINRMPAIMPEYVGLAVFLLFLTALLQPLIPNPLLLDQATAWTILCYGFTASIVLLCVVSRRLRWQLTPFDYFLAAYLIAVFATWPSSVNRHASNVAISQLLPQIAVYCSLRLLADMWPALGRVTVAVLVGGIAILLWRATDYHLRYGLSERLVNFPELEWNGRAGLGTAAAIQFGLLIAIWQQARSRVLRLASMCLIVASVFELLFLYTRDAWVAAAAVLVVAFITAFRLGGFRRYLIAIVIIGSVVALGSTPYMVHLAKRAVGIESGLDEGGLELRVAAWHDAVRLIGRHAVRGVGLGNYIQARRNVQLPPDPGVPAALIPIHPHNLFLQQTAELGIFGGLTYFALWSTVIWAGWRVSALRPNGLDGRRAIFYAIAAMVVANLGENMFLDSVNAERIRVHTLAWILMAIVVAEWNRTRRAEKHRFEGVF